MDDNRAEGVPLRRDQGLADFKPAPDLKITNMDVNVLAQHVSQNGFNSREKTAAAYANANTASRGYRSVRRQFHPPFESLGILNPKLTSEIKSLHQIANAGGRHIGAAKSAKSFRRKRYESGQKRSPMLDKAGTNDESEIGQGSQIIQFGVPTSQPPCWSKDSNLFTPDKQLLWNRGRRQPTVKSQLNSPPTE